MNTLLGDITRDHMPPVLMFRPCGALSSQLFSYRVAACGGTQVPTHNGYKSEKAKPWKKPKTLKFDDKLEAKAEGELSYAEMRARAGTRSTSRRPASSTLKLEITPPGDATNDDFDLGVEVLDPGFRVISKSDLRGRRHRRAEQGQARSYDLAARQVLRSPLPAGPHGHRRLRAARDVQADGAAGSRATSRRRSRSCRRCRWCRSTTTRRAVQAADHGAVEVARPPKTAPPAAEAEAAAADDREVSARIIGITVVSGGTADHGRHAAPQGRARSRHEGQDRRASRAVVR